ILIPHECSLIQTAPCTYYVFEREFGIVLRRIFRVLISVKHRIWHFLLLAQIAQIVKLFKFRISFFHLSTPYRRKRSGTSPSATMRSMTSALKRTQRPTFTYAIRRSQTHILTVDSFKPKAAATCDTDNKPLCVCLSMPKIPFKAHIPLLPIKLRHL